MHTLMKYFQKLLDALRSLLNSSELEGRLSRNAFDSLILRIGAVILAFLINVVLARAMTVSEYGSYIYGMSWLSILLIPATLGFDKLLVREISIYHSQKEWGRVKAFYKLATSLTLGFSILIGLSLSAVIQLARLPTALIGIFYMVSMLLPIMTLIRVVQAILQGIHVIVWGQFPEYIIQPLLLILFTAVIFYGLKIPLNALYVMILTVATSVLALLTGIYLVWHWLPADIHTAQASFMDYRSWIPSSIPMMLVGGIYILNDQLATMMLGFLGDVHQVGIYAAAEKLARFTAFMLYALNPALGPVFASLFALNERKRLQKVVTLSAQAITLFALFIFLAFVISPAWFLSIFSYEFVEGQTALLVLCIGQLINAATGSVGVLLIMVGHERNVVMGAAAGTLINLILGFLLIPSMQATGAAIATGVGVTLTNLILSISVFRKLKIYPTALGALFKSNKNSFSM